MEFGGISSSFLDADSSWDWNWIVSMYLDVWLHRCLNGQWHSCIVDKE